ncbi:hypothetical protein EXIGLDRAFT_772532 [Exidia glandulosa HHB12029]|uniref:Uncharacterized protein n=1 Tax=Exidia glandulosa HHB12029 TaxID=1314781 RepID=A0A165F9P3_EXIGL|nr:hypothetical protein EXIGLDRAFT_772532 [Exidia glandulosa HHB12029]
MSRPRGVNPHNTSYEATLTTCSRRELFSPAVPERSPSPGDVEEIEALNNAVRARFTTDMAVSPSPVKRRKLDTNNEVESLVEFRLISGTSRPISLLPKRHPGVPAQWPTEDTREERRIRQARAQIAAVDPPFLSPASVAADGTLRSFRPSDTVPALAVVTFPKVKLPGLNNASLDWSRATHRETDPVSCCPIVPMTATTEPSASHRMHAHKRGRRRPVKERTVVQPTFWRPPLGLGGKTAGYAMGWPASAPGARGYIRATK